jgi:Asp/Glu/hydantoin racemase
MLLPEVHSANRTTQWGPICRATISKDGADAIIIGGGPLAVAARRIAPELSIPLIEPVEAGALCAISRAQERASAELF